MNPRQEARLNYHAEVASVSPTWLDGDVILDLYRVDDFDDEGNPTAKPYRTILVDPAGREFEFYWRTLTAERRSEIAAEMADLDERRRALERDRPPEYDSGWRREVTAIGAKRRRLKVELLPQTVRVLVSKLTAEITAHQADEQEAWTEDHDRGDLYSLAAHEWQVGLVEQVEETLLDLAVEPDYQPFVFDRVEWEREVETRKAEAQAER